MNLRICETTFCRNACIDRKIAEITTDIRKTGNSNNCVKQYEKLNELIHERLRLEKEELVK